MEEDNQAETLDRLEQIGVDWFILSIEFVFTNARIKFPLMERSNDIIGQIPEEVQYIFLYALSIFIMEPELFRDCKKRFLLQKNPFFTLFAQMYSEDIIKQAQYGGQPEGDSNDVSTSGPRLPKSRLFSLWVIACTFLSWTPPIVDMAPVKLPKSPQQERSDDVKSAKDTFAKFLRDEEVENEQVTSSRSSFPEMEYQKTQLYQPTAISPVSNITSWYEFAEDQERQTLSLNEVIKRIQQRQQANGNVIPIPDAIKVAHKTCKYLQNNNGTCSYIANLLSGVPPAKLLQTLDLAKNQTISSGKADYGMVPSHWGDQYPIWGDWEYVSNSSLSTINTHFKQQLTQSFGNFETELKRGNPAFVLQPNTTLLLVTGVPSHKTITLVRSVNGTIKFALFENNVFPYAAVNQVCKNNGGFNAKINPETKRICDTAKRNAMNSTPRLITCDPDFLTPDEKGPDGLDAGLFKESNEPFITYYKEMLVHSNSTGDVRKDSVNVEKYPVSGARKRTEFTPFNLMAMVSNLTFITTEFKDGLKAISTAVKLSGSNTSTPSGPVQVETSVSVLSGNDRNSTLSSNPIDIFFKYAPLYVGSCNNSTFFNQTSLVTARDTSLFFSSPVSTIHLPPFTRTMRSCKQSEPVSRDEQSVILMGNPGSTSGPKRVSTIDLGITFTMPNKETYTNKCFLLSLAYIMKIDICKMFQDLSNHLHDQESPSGMDASDLSIYQDERRRILSSGRAGESDYIDGSLFLKFVRCRNELPNGIIILTTSVMDDQYHVDVSESGNLGIYIRPSNGSDPTPQTPVVYNLGESHYVVGEQGLSNEVLQILLPKMMDLSQVNSQAPIQLMTGMDEVDGGKRKRTRNRTKKIRRTFTKKYKKRGAKKNSTKRKRKMKK